MDRSEIAKAVGVDDSEVTNGENTLYYTSLFEYVATGDTELSFKEGEVLAVLDASGDWWYAQNGHEESGWIPPSYLDIDNPIPFEVVFNQFLEDSVHEDDPPRITASQRLPPPDPIEDAPAPLLGSLSGSRRDSRFAASSPAVSLYISNDESEAAVQVRSPKQSPKQSPKTSPRLRVEPSSPLSPLMSPKPDTQASSPSNIEDYLQFPASFPLDDEAEDKDMDFSEKMNDWCKVTTEVLDETIRESAKYDPPDAAESPAVPIETTAPALTSEHIEKDTAAVAVSSTPRKDPAASSAAEHVGETVEIVTDVFVKSVVGSLAAAAGEEAQRPEEVVERIETTSEDIISGLQAGGGGGQTAHGVLSPRPPVARPPPELLQQQAREAVGRIIDTALGRKVLQARYAGVSDQYIQSAFSGAVARIAERIINQQYRAAHARQIKRTISKPLSSSPDSPAGRKVRSQSISTHDPNRLMDVSHMREAKIRLLSMESIELAAHSPTPPADEYEDDPFEEPAFEAEEELRPAARRTPQRPRPKSSSAHLPSRSTIEFDRVLRATNCSSRMFVKQFQIQRAQRARKNAKAVFEALQKSIPAGESVSISVHDYVSTVVCPSNGKAAGAARKEGWNLTQNVERSKKFKKSSAGMVIFVDPGIDTTDVQCILHIAYGPQFGQTEAITIANDGSYCGLELTGAKWNFDTSVPIVPPMSKRNDFDLNRLALSFDADVPDRTLPGWCGTLPIFIPSDRCKCRLEVRKSEKVVDLSQSPLRFYYGNHASGLSLPARPISGLPQRPRTAPLAPISSNEQGRNTESSFERLSLFCFAAPSVDAAIKTVNDNLGSTLKTDVANENAGGGLSSLHVAALHGNMEGVRHLVDGAGASVNARCKRSNHTPLHEAIIGGHTAVVAFLLERGANVMTRDNTDSLPIHIACSNNHISIVRLLLKLKSAKKTLLIKDGKGKTARQLCASKFLRTIVEDTMRKLYILKTCTLLEKGHRGQELYETLSKPLLTRPGTALVYRPGGPSI